MVLDEIVGGGRLELQFEVLLHCQVCRYHGVIIGLRGARTADDARSVSDCVAHASALPPWRVRPCVAHDRPAGGGRNPAPLTGPMPLCSHITCNRPVT